MGDITKQLFKDDRDKYYNQELDLKIKDKHDSQPREVVFSKKVTTKAEKSDDNHQNPSIHL